MKGRHLALGAALLLAAGLVFFGDNTPAPDVAEAVPRSVVARKSGLDSGLKPGLERGVAPPAGPVIVRLKAREELAGDGFAAMGAGGDDVFLSQDWAPPAPKPQPQPAPPPPPPPTAPPLPFTYLGKAASEGHWEVFLARAGQTYIVRNKMVIDGTYRVDAIAPPRMTLTYLPLNQVQQINIGVLD